MRFLEALPNYPMATIMLIIVMCTVFATVIEFLSKRKNKKDKF